MTGGAIPHLHRTENKDLGCGNPQREGTGDELPLTTGDGSQRQHDRKLWLDQKEAERWARKKRPASLEREPAGPETDQDHYRRLAVKDETPERRDAAAADTTNTGSFDVQQPTERQTP